MTQLSPHDIESAAESAVPDQRGVNLFESDPEFERLLRVYLPADLLEHLRPRLTRLVSRPEMLMILRTSVPRAVTLSLHQLVLLGLVGFASIMSEGSVSVFQFAFNLQSVPLAVIGVSYSVAAFPILAQLYAEGKMDRFTRHVLTSLRHVIFWSVPILVLLIVVRAQFVRLILGSGAFDWDDTRLTAAALALFSVSLLAQAVHLLLVRALYAVGNTRLPFYVTLISSVSVLLFALGLYSLFITTPAFQVFLESALRVRGVPGTEVLVLPIAYTLALFLHSSVLLVLSRRHLHFRAVVLLRNLVEALLAGFVAGAFAYITLNFFDAGLRTDTLIGIALQGFLAGVVGLAGAVGVYALIGSRELSETLGALQRRMFKTTVVGPQDEDHLAV